jgi:hypothetical protein
VASANSTTFVRFGSAAVNGTAGNAVQPIIDGAAMQVAVYSRHYGAGLAIVRPEHAKWQRCVGLFRGCGHEHGDYQCVRGASERNLGYTEVLLAVVR